MLDITRQHYLVKLIVTDKNFTSIQKTKLLAHFRRRILLITVNAKIFIRCHESNQMVVTIMEDILYDTGNFSKVGILHFET